jgi:hypothetical protein
MTRISRIWGGHSLPVCPPTPRIGGRDDAGLETWITRARAVDVKVILETDLLLLRQCVEDDAEAFFTLNTGH